MASPFASHFFIEQNAFSQQSSNQVFGPTDINNFRLTSKFTLTDPKKAYSICKGIVLVQPQSGVGNSNKVNLILRPFKQPFPGLNIKYFIYRGLQKTDFFDGSGNIIASGSDFIVKINADYDAFYAENPRGENGQTITKPPFASRFIGYDPNITDESILLSDYFFKNSEIASGTENHPFELPMIDAGKSLGHFASGECGIDVVLNYGDYKHNFDNGEFIFDLGYARKAEAIIALTGTDYEKRLQREQSTQFIDIAAFYGLFVKEGKVSVVDNAEVKTDKAGTAIYSDVINNFATKNNWYIYIQGDRNRSYDFYNNYKITESGANNIKCGALESSMSETAYGTNGWPVIINIQTQDPIVTSNNLFLQLVTDNNVNTVLYGQLGAIDNAQQNNFCNADDLRLPPDSEGNYERLTKVVKLSAPAGDGNNIASISLLLYQGISYGYGAGTVLDENDQPIPVMARPNFFDDVFDLIHAEPLLKSVEGNTEFSKMTSEKLKVINHYYNKQQQGISVVQTLTVNNVIETGIEETPTLARVTYITETTDVMNNAVSPTGNVTLDTKTSTSAGGTIAKSKTYQLPEPYYYNLRLFTDSTQTITGLELKTLDGSTPNKILLGLTKVENDSIKDLIPTDGSLKNPRLFLIDLFEDGNELISPENIKYQKYKVGIVAEDSDEEGKTKLVLPTIDVIVYSLDRKYHFSKGYSEYMTENKIEALSLDLNLALTIE
ncbi:hypothetical protein FLJC2902T_12800 [Flavobacterium limnosediminis JC2902]|uniref:Uncharacterized protein n=1 Tax=Flavobacterium limnosediminis JC2902 TaxID=1341181 RepID=V6SQH0_9FLAO|nr:hypothetical protein [Flavobacterium limnosediminis]ESU28689.1 hypothetical protein FLJC2902T_12800 [Flavobacterium limnosediminis JC2902]